MVELAALVRALEVVETASAVPDGLTGQAALGWRAGTTAALTALRTAVEYQAALLPPPPRPRRDPASPGEQPGEQAGIDWCQG
ncbi:hypothetical protein [Embleya sp. AB8]|uniref:hypothetical protein n=1 Tax=Embleya sp. AB8 TaxID=3156304 RepID=UPI003C721BBC